MKVKNLNGTTDNKCKCGPWLEHWKKFSGQAVPRYCSETTCYGPSEVGAHVQKDSSIDANWYIVPLCSACNQKRGQTLSISDGVALVPANVKETCAKAA